MGYTTTFSGAFKLDKPLDDNTFNFLVRLNNTRRMKRSTNKLMALFGVETTLPNGQIIALPGVGYGVEGEFFVGGTGFAGQDKDDSIVDYNTPPRRQPSLWCHWRPTDDRMFITWDDGEKFYSYVEWLEYIINNILAPRGYTLAGDVEWCGEEEDDIGTISVVDNTINIEH